MCDLLFLCQVQTGASRCHVKLSTLSHNCVFSSPGTNVLGKVMSYPRRRCHRCHCHRRYRRQYQVKVSVFLKFKLGKCCSNSEAI